MLNPKIIYLIAAIILMNGCSSLPSEGFSLKQGEEKFGFSYKNNKLERNGKQIHFQNLNADKEVLIQPSPNNEYFILTKWDIDYGGEQLIVIDAKTNFEVTSIPKSPVGRIGKKAYWDNNDRFAVVPVTGEGQNGVHLIDIKRKKSGALNIKNLTKNRCEIQSIQEDFDFSENGKLKFHVDIALNPWNENLNCTEGKFYPTYLATLDLKTLKTSYVKD